MKRLFKPKSLAGKTLYSMGLRLCLVMALGTVISYVHLRNELQNQAIERLGKYASMRGQREQIIFTNAQINHKILMDEFISHYNEYDNKTIDSRFSQLTTQYPDGHIRSRKSKTPKRHDVGIYIERGVSVNKELKKKILVAYELAKEFGPAFHGQFQDTYFSFPEKAAVIYWPESNDWVYDIKGDYKIENEEWFQVSLPKNDPDKKTTWTGSFYDAVGKTWMVTVATPVYKDGVYLGSVHHDVMLDEIFERTIASTVEGTFNYLIRGDGRLIAHPLFQEQIEQKNGQLNVSDVGDSTLKEQFESLKGAEFKDGVLGVDRKSDAYLGVAKIEGPEWYLISFHPKSIIRGTAYSTAVYVLVLGVISLVLEMIFVFFVLRTHVTMPLGKLVLAAQQLARGVFSVTLDTQRKDELGDFSRSFITMKNVIQERDLMLEKHNKELEKIIEERTRELEQTRAESVHASKMASLGEMAGGVAHEINTPLTVIQMRANAIQKVINEKRENLDDVLVAANAIEKTVDRISKIIKGLKKFSRDTSRDEYEVASIKQIVTDTLDLASQKFKYNNVDIKVECPDMMEVECRSVQISQVVLNLLSNANDAIQELPEKWIHIKGEYDSAKQNAYLSITDSGKGISPEIAEKIMRPFFSTKGASKGTGLGLSISRNIAHDHGGSLELDRKASNTRFILKLPLSHSVRNEHVS